MNQFALCFMASRLFVRGGSPWKTRGCKCSGEQTSEEGAVVGAQEVSGPRDIGPCGRPQRSHRGYVGAERGRGPPLEEISRLSAAPRPRTGCEPRAGRVARPACQGMEREGAGRGEPGEQRCLSVIPANKILFHYPHYNWFTAFSVYLSIRAAVKWLGKAIA